MKHISMMAAAVAMLAGAAIPVSAKSTPDTLSAPDLPAPMPQPVMVAPPSFQDSAPPPPSGPPKAADAVEVIMPPPAFVTTDTSQDDQVTL